MKVKYGIALLLFFLRENCTKHKKSECITYQKQKYQIQIDKFKIPDLCQTITKLLENDDKEYKCVGNDSIKVGNMFKSFLVAQLNKEKNVKDCEYNNVQYFSLKISPTWEEIDLNILLEEVRKLHQKTYYGEDPKELFGILKGTTNIKNDEQNEICFEKIIFEHVKDNIVPPNSRFLDDIGFILEPYGYYGSLRDLMMNTKNHDMTNKILEFENNF